ncbi:outer membrane protein assembly factor BamA [Pseudomonas sp. F1_0610]|uniref:outer membrane protein assembly factor BamA n=1 Tax=Pseudomonas sp. F1_0610 TaxID=3114284 RepID=UPI0039C4DAA8
MKRLLLPAVISALMIGEVHAASFTVSDIRVNGLQRISSGSVFAALPLDVGHNVDDKVLVETTRALFKTGYFQDIQLGRDGDVLVITVLERPSISSLDIEGNKAIKKEDLLKGLKQSGLAEGEIFQRATLEGVRNELQRQYVAQGRYSASIETEVVEQPRNRVAIKVKINEGSVASIQHINIVGNNVFSNEDLIDLFELKTKNWMSFIKNDDKYAREKLSGDLERLRSYYLDRGYINMDIISTQVSITPDKKNVYITVNIDEGERYRIRDIKLTGDLKVPEDEVRGLILTQPGQVFSRKVMTTTNDLITRRLGNEGYTFAHVNAIPEPHAEDNTVSLTYVVDPGKRAYVNRINFRGNTKTEDEVLRREMRQMEGGWASTYLIDQSKTRLERLGYFKNITVETPAVPGADDQVDVNFEVEEQPSGSITASIGFAQNAGMILGGAISQSNFLGTGNQVSMGLTRSEYQSSYNFSFLNPYWTDDGVSLGYNMFYRETNYDKLNYDVSSYSIDSYGAGVNLGYPISETSRLNFGASVQKDTLKTGKYTVEEIYDFMEKEGKSFTNYKVSAGWSQSTLNRGLMPTRGHSQSLSAEVSVPMSDLKFYRLDYFGQVFKPLSENYALRFHTELGYGDGYGSTNKMPFYEHYYAGGFGSVRGFKDSTLGPRSTAFRGRNGMNQDPDQDPLPFGGNVLIQGGVELIVPTPFVKDQQSLRTVVFWDVGNVFDTNCSKAQKDRGEVGCNIRANNLASSVGVGLTWVTALGPLSFSLGMPVKKPKNSETQVFQFSLGQTF